MQQRIISYRPDIDGMRCLAVLLVVVFHLWPQHFRSGFIGVDIFFVISGYLITSIIVKQLNNQSFSFLLFYAHRVKRILPIFLIVVLFSAIVSYLFFDPKSLITYVGSLRASSLYFANVYFARLNNYFAGGTRDYPLLHIWSLSVEEQYYYLWPLLLFITHRLSKANMSKFILGVILFTYSYTYSVYCALNNIDTAYYSIFTRTFELMAGSVLAIFVFDDRLINKIYIQSQAKYFANIYSGIGLLLIVMSILILENWEFLYPGYISLLPILGVVLIILSGKLYQFSFVNKILSFRLFIYIGLISYPLYLWHWVLIAFWNYFNPNTDCSIMNGIYLFIISIVLSILSYLFIEIPIRTKQMNIIYLFVFLQIIPIIMTFYYRQYIMSNNGLTVYTRNISYFKKDTTDYDSRKVNKASITIYGDSHAAQYVPFWNEIAKKNNFNFSTVWTPLCYPLLDDETHAASNLNLSGNKQDCKRQIENFTSSLQNYHIVILSGRWGLYLDDPKNNNHGSSSKMKIDFAVSFARTLKILHDKGIGVIIMGDTPSESTFNIEKYLRRKLFCNVLPCKFWSITDSFPIIMYDNGYSNAIVKSIVSQYDNAYYVDVNKNAISQISAFPFNNDMLLYWDYGHLYSSGMKLIADKYVTTNDFVSLTKFIDKYNFNESK